MGGPKLESKEYDMIDFTEYNNPRPNLHDQPL